MAAAASPAGGGGGGSAAGSNATDVEITRTLHAILREKSIPNPNPNQNPGVTTFNDVVIQLQSKLGVDLSHKLDFIRTQIQLLFQLPPQLPRPAAAAHVQQPPPSPHSPVVVPSKEQHFVFQHHPQYHHPASFHPSPSAFHTFPPHHAMGHHPQVQFQPQPHPQVQFQPQPHPQVHPVASRVEPSSPKESAPAKPKRKGGTGGLSKLCRVSPELEAIVGQPAMPRTEIVRQLWVYIRKNNLQDPNNKRKIICNDQLRLVFETDSTDMFKMNKLLAKHIGPMEPTKESEAKKLKVEADPEVKSSSESSPSVKISEDLANFFGVSDTVMPQKEITDRIWQYIHDNQLVDRQNSTLVSCDEKLQKIFGRESIPALEIPEVLAHHLIRR